MKALEEQPADKTPPQDPKAELVGRLETELEQQMAEADWEEALSVAGKILAVDPDNRTAKQKKVTIRTQLSRRAARRAAEREAAGDLEAALDAYKIAAGHRPDPALDEKIRSLQKKLVERAIRRSADLYLEALTAHQEGRAKDARRLCETALELDPKNVQAHNMLQRLKALR
jgi:tetratricopeptide (TPR) repeat protein